MQWFQIKEHSAGKKRLLLSWYLYKIFGKKILYIIAFLVSFATFIFAPKIRGFSRKYLSIIEKETGIKPTLHNQFKHILSYANSLVDKMLIYSGNFDINNILFENDSTKNILFSTINQSKSVFFICNHIGNIEVLQALLANKITRPDFYINIFLSNTQSQIFNDFINQIKLNLPVKLFPVEDLGINTGVELKENLDNGEVAFIAGDRLAENNDKKCIPAELFSHKIFLPKGTFVLAKLMNVPTYFISAIKTGQKYTIYIEEQPCLAEDVITESYVNFLKKCILINPYQFYHFYDFFN